MPKLKSHKGAAKRFKVTGNGKIKIRRAFKGHILEKKSAKRKRKFKKEESEKSVIHFFIDHSSNGLGSRP